MLKNRKNALTRVKVYHNAFSEVVTEDIIKFLRVESPFAEMDMQEPNVTQEERGLVLKEKTKFGDYYITYTNDGSVDITGRNLQRFNNYHFTNVRDMVYSGRKISIPEGYEKSTVKVIGFTVFDMDNLYLDVFSLLAGKTMFKQDDIYDTFGVNRYKPCDVAYGMDKFYPDRNTNKCMILKKFINGEKGVFLYSITVKGKKVTIYSKDRDIRDIPYAMLLEDLMGANLKAAYESLNT